MAKRLEWPSVQVWGELGHTAESGEKVATEYKLMCLYKYLIQFSHHHRYTIIQLNKYLYHTGCRSVKTTVPSRRYRRQLAYEYRQELMYLSHLSVLVWLVDLSIWPVQNLLN